MLKANKFVGKVIDTVTGTTFTKRSTEKIKGALKNPKHLENQIINLFLFAFHGGHEPSYVILTSYRPKYQLP